MRRAPQTRQVCPDHGLFVDIGRVPCAVLVLWRRRQGRSESEDSVVAVRACSLIVRRPRSKTKLRSRRRERARKKKKIKLINVCNAKAQTFLFVVRCGARARRSRHPTPPD